MALSSERLVTLRDRMDRLRDSLEAELAKGPARDQSLVGSYDKLLDDVYTEIQEYGPCQASSVLKRVQTLETRVAVYEKSTNKGKAHTEPRAYPLVGFTKEGRVAVLANALAEIGLIIQKLQLELQKRQDPTSLQGSPSGWLVNGYLLSIIPGLQNLLDNIAKLCQEQEPLEAFCNVATS
ncbi:hypothetical protein WJX77_012544 [Trebouxia sp. C0004]